MTTLTLHGVDGSAWELMDRWGPVQLLGGLGGLHLPVVANQWATTARSSGRSWKGYTADYRQFAINLRVGDAAPPFRTGDDWRALDAQFWKALAHDASASLTFNGGRSLSFRLGDDNSHEFPKDPALLGKAAYAIACVADRPEWTGPLTTASYSLAPTTATDYYNGATKGPPFTISAPLLSRTASISNPGDLPAYPLWRIVGPSTTATVGVGTRLISIPFALQAGQQVLIDTARQTIVDGSGINLWPQMGSTPVDFAPVPPGGTVQIAIGLQTGGATSRIDVSLTPLYRRAW